MLYFEKKNPKKRPLDQGGANSLAAYVSKPKAQNASKLRD